MEYTIYIDDLNMSFVSEARNRLNLEIGYYDVGHRNSDPQIIALNEYGSNHVLSINDFLEILQENSDIGLSYTYTQNMKIGGSVQHNFSVYSLLHSTYICTEFTHNFEDGWKVKMVDFVTRCAQCVGAYLKIQSGMLSKKDIEAMSNSERV